MILPPDLAKKALEGRVTMACFSKKTPKCAYKTGHDYALQSGKRSVGRLTVLEVRDSTTSSLDLNDARRMGFRTRTDFYERWKGAEDVWLIRFIMGVHVDTPRLLAKRCGTHSGDYVSSASQALPETAEEVSSTTQRRFAAEGAANLALNRQIPRERLVEAVEAMRQQAGNAKHRRRWRSIEHQLSMMDREAS